MDGEANKAVVRQFVDRVYVQLDQHAVDELVADDFESHGTPTFDKNGLRAATQRMGSALDQIAFTIADEIGEGDRVAVRLTAEARQVGDFMGMTASGRSYEIEEIHIFRVRDGQIAEHWHQLDAMGLMAQLKGESSGVGGA